jgi:hypothetical protein
VTVVAFAFARRVELRDSAPFQASEMFDIEEALIQAANKTALSEASRFVLVMLVARLVAVLCGTPLAWRMLAPKAIASFQRCR